MSFELLIDIIGWFGALLLLLAYGLLSARRLEGHSARYQLMNIQGSLCLLANAAYHRAFPSAFVNLIWVLIAGLALACYARTPAKPSPALEKTGPAERSV
jgi:hypothetical protein